MQAEWTHLFWLYCNNPPAAVRADVSLASPVVPLFPRSSQEAIFCTGNILPDFAIDDEYVLKYGTQEQELAVAETYTAGIVVRQYTKGERHLVNTSSRTIIDDIFLWSTTMSTVLSVYERVCRVCVKYRIFLR